MENSTHIEIWKAIPDTQHFISSFGNVKNENNLILKTQYNEFGYETLAITINGGSVNFKIHRLVAEAFIDRVAGKDFVNHIDGFKYHNFSSNLEWVTFTENMRHAFENGLAPVGEDRTQAVLTDANVFVIKQMLSEGFKNSDIAEKFKVARGTISKIRSGHTWTHVKTTFSWPLQSEYTRVSKLSANDIPLIRARILKGDTDREIGKIFKVNYGTIYQIRHNITWKNY